ncbi:fasciclin domain-containing protein [Myceligenerans crystallogenes]|uniref:Cell surface glycolipoprotein Mpt83 n=1 Tax=Myceligenerans crystallogenes TaxID=316335 RepID=A0ABN2NAG9_9MICO
MNVRTRKSYAAAGIVALTVLGLTACSGGEGDASGKSDTTAGAEAEAPAEEPTEEMTDDAVADPAADLVGPGCAAYAEQVPDGPGSVTGMSTDPVAVAASNNPLLKTLVAAVSGEVNPDVNLVDTLNGDEFTVFAPVDDAFKEIDAETMETLSKDGDMLTEILTYHVVPGQLTPDQVIGEQTTVQGDTLEVSGSGDALKVNDAKVICGGVMTQNATVYLVDAVLMPPM